MKKTVIIAGAFLSMLTACGKTTKTEEQNSDNTADIEVVEEITSENSEKFLIKEDGVDIFVLGESMPTEAEDYEIKKELVNAGEGMTEPVYYVSKGGEELFEIDPEFDPDSGEFTDKISAIRVLSPEYKTAEGIGVGSSAKDLVKFLPEYAVYYTYVSDAYWISSESSMLQFFLDEKDYTKKIEFDSDLTKLNFADFKEDAKIIAIRIL